MALLHYATGIREDLVGIEEGNRDGKCEEPEVCCVVPELDTVIRLRAVQIVNGNIVIVGDRMFLKQS